MIQDAASTPAAPLFLAVEGPDGSGKSTQAAALADALRARGASVVLTREPGGTDLGERIRSLVLDPAHAPIDARTEALLFAAARAAHAEHAIRPALAAGSWVVSDRYVDSSIAYQGRGRGLGVEPIATLNDWATGSLLPDLTVVLDVAARTAEARRRTREQGAGHTADRMEQETANQHELLRSAFLERAAADPERYLVLDASRPTQELTDAVLERVWHA